MLNSIILKKQTGAVSVYDNHWWREPAMYCSVEVRMNLITPALEEKGLVR
jgi:hypothetical protein